PPFRVSDPLRPGRHRPCQRDFGRTAIRNRERAGVPRRESGTHGREVALKNYAGKMVGRDGIEPPTPGFSDLGGVGTTGRYRMTLRGIPASYPTTVTELRPITPDAVRWF